MLWFALVILFISLSLLLLILLPFSVRFRLQGRAELNGSWALAGGAHVGPFMISAAVARGVVPTMGAHIFGHRVFHHTLQAHRDKHPRKRSETSRAKRKRPSGAHKGSGFSQSLRRAYQTLPEWADPIDLMLFVLEERKRFYLNQFKITLAYGLDDMALMGRIAGGLYVLNSLLPARVWVSPAPLWGGEKRLEVALGGKLTVFPGRLVTDMIWFGLRHIQVRKFIRIMARKGKGV